MSKRQKRQTKGRKTRGDGDRSGRGAPRRVSPRVKCPRTCAHCGWAMQATGHWQRIIMSRWPGLLLCLNHPEAPGHLREVTCNGTCRNFRPKPAPALRLEPPEPPNDKVRFIALTQGKFALVDADDYEWLSQYKWRATYNSGRWYAATTIKNKNVLMHRLIMNAPKGMVVDHIDGNGLHDCRGNLRVCTREENMYNSRRSKGTSQFKGVSFERLTGKWRAMVTFKHEPFNLGLYDDEVEAARAYDRKAVELFGEFAYLNFPEEHGRSLALACESM